MKGYRAVFKGTRDDPEACPETEPRRTRWFLSQREAAEEADLLNARYHGLAYKVRFEEEDVEAYNVVWYDRIEHQNGDMRFYAPMKEGGHAAAYAHLRLVFGDGNFSIQSVQFVRSSVIPRRF
jgi:hypothetical protein